MRNKVWFWVCYFFATSTREWLEVQDSRSKSAEHRRYNRNLADKAIKQYRRAQHHLRRILKSAPEDPKWVELMAKCQRHIQHTLELKAQYR